MEKHLLIDKISNALPGAYPKGQSIKNIPFFKRSNTILFEAKHIYIYIYIKMSFWSRTNSKTFNRYSEFHASNEAIIRQPDDCFIRSMKLRVAIKCF